MGFLLVEPDGRGNPLGKIAGYHYRSGWFWESVEIQTRGQKANSISCLCKRSGYKIKEILESMKG